MQEKELLITGGCLHYEAHHNKIYITGFQGNAGQIQIPGFIEGYAVTGIERKAFLSKKHLRRIILPDTIEEVGDWAFAYCDNLEQAQTPCRDIRFGKAVFLNCARLKRISIRGKDDADAALMAAAVTAAEAYYLLDISEAGNAEWLAKWDARMLEMIHRSDRDGYSRQILCGEEDYGSTDVDAYMNARRKEKVRLMLLRLLHQKGLSPQVKDELEYYLQTHTKGCQSEEAWQVVWKEHGDDREYYRLFAELGCITQDNFDEILSDLGEGYPEMKAYFMRYREETLGRPDFFCGLEL